MNVAADIKNGDWAALFGAYGGKSGALLRSDVGASSLKDLVAGRLVYLATPYTKQVVDRTGGFCEWRSDDMAYEAAHWALQLAIYGITAISPIAAAVGMIDRDFGRTLDPLDAEFWTNWCSPLLRACDVVVIPQITGWNESAGIWHEAYVALQSNKRVFVLAGTQA